MLLSFLLLLCLQENNIFPGYCRSNGRKCFIALSFVARRQQQKKGSRLTESDLKKESNDWKANLVLSKKSFCKLIQVQFWALEAVKRLKCSERQFNLWIKVGKNVVRHETYRVLDSIVQMPHTIYKNPLSSLLKLEIPWCIPSQDIRKENKGEEESFFPLNARSGFRHSFPQRKQQVILHWTQTHCPHPTRKKEERCWDVSYFHGLP